jgi:hypothetical protein
LVAVAEIDRAPTRRGRDVRVRPGAVRQIYPELFVIRPVFVDRHRTGLLMILHGPDFSSWVVFAGGCEPTTNSATRKALTRTRRGS